MQFEKRVRTNRPWACTAGTAAMYSTADSKHPAANIADSLPLSPSPMPSVSATDVRRIRTTQRLKCLHAVLMTGASQ